MNDYGYEHLFSRQVNALGAEGDVLIGITTSGKSKNVINAFHAANQLHMTSIGLLGNDGGDAKDIIKESIIIPSKTTARIQEMHILIGHILCDMIEEGLNLKE